VVAAFDGGQMTSAAGALRLGATDRAIDLGGRFAACFEDGRARRLAPRGDTPPKEIILDLDATDDPLHGDPEGRFFHGSSEGYCDLPLYVFCGRHLLAAELRRSNIAWPLERGWGPVPQPGGQAAGAVEEIERLVAQIRIRWPAVGIVLRADSGFAREELMTWCEENRVDYVFGLARDPRLLGAIAAELAAAETESLARGGPARRFADFAGRTRASWSRERRVVAKAEHLPHGADPRFVVTSLLDDQIAARPLYEDVYCARGEVENRIQEQQLDRFADRASAATMRAHQLRLWFASFAYVLREALRRIALRHTQFATVVSLSTRTPPVATYDAGLRAGLIERLAGLDQLDLLEAVLDQDRDRQSLEICHRSTQRLSPHLRARTAVRLPRRAYRPRIGPALIWLSRRVRSIRAADCWRAPKSFQKPAAEPELVGGDVLGRCAGEELVQPRPAVREPGKGFAAAAGHEVAPRAPVRQQRPRRARLRHLVPAAVLRPSGRDHPARYGPGDRAPARATTGSDVSGRGQARYALVARRRRLMPAARSGGCGGGPGPRGGARTARPARGSRRS